MDKQYIIGFDGFRACSVILVIIQHWGPHHFYFPILEKIFSVIIPNGSFGVDAFFVLSGFLITRILLKGNSSRGKIDFIKTFVIRRSLRIFPLYFLFLIILVIVNYGDISRFLGYYAFYISNYLAIRCQTENTLAHTWSLSVEEQFYLIWPVFIVFINKKYLLSTILISLLLGILASFYLSWKMGALFSFVTLSCFMAFAIGGLYAYSESSKELVPNLIRYLKLLLPFAVAGYLFQVYGYGSPVIRLFNSIISINILIFIKNNQANIIVRKILGNNILSYIGKISYGLYLLHYIIPDIYRKGIDYIASPKSYVANNIFFFKYSIFSYSCQLLILFIVAALSYKYLEMPFLRYKTKFPMSK